MRLLLTTALLLATTSAFASQGVALSPVINDLLPGQRVATVKVTNDTGCDAPFQFSVTKWTQVGGVDVDTPTQEVRALPAIATLSSGATQIIRIARMAPPNGTAEEAYRLDVQQVTACPSPPGNGPTAKIVFHLQAPIFYRGPAWKADLHAVWSNGQLKLRNEGTATADLFSVSVNGQPWTAHSIHVLPGSSIGVVPKAGPMIKPATIDVKIGPKTTAHLTVE